MASETELHPVTIEGARLLFRNFTGAENRFNEPGNRNFCIVLDPKQAEQMKADGWNVKFPDPRDEEEEARDPYLPVAVKYTFRPPLIVMITSTGRTNLVEDTCGILDWADITDADLIIAPSRWDVGGKSGIKAYLRSLYVTVNEDVLARKYAIIEQDMAREQGR